MNVKRVALALVAAGGFGFLMAAPNASVGQAQSASADDPRVPELAKQVAEQQQKISDNQTAIEQQLKTLAEDIRVARIYVSRTGGPNK